MKFDDLFLAIILLSVICGIVGVVIVRAEKAYNELK